MSASSAAAEPAMRGAGAATRLIIASSVGNALEFYEILVYGYFAVTIAKVFFPAANEAVSLLVTLGTFGISFLARPVGAIFLGAYGDRKGRKRALRLSILLMTIGTGLMTVMPSYGSVGLLAPILVIAARLLQGFSVGGEFTSSTAFLVEHRPDRAGFFASWQWSEPRFCRAGSNRFGRFADDQHVRRHAAGVGLADPVRRGSLDRSGRPSATGSTKRRSLSKRERREGRSAICSLASGIGFS
jgi:MHS family proline/betaine transporter-like MFS transporter